MNNELVKAGKDIVEAHVGTLGYRKVYTPTPEEARALVACHTARHATDKVHYCSATAYVAESLKLIEAVGSEFMNYNLDGQASIHQINNPSEYRTAVFKDLFNPWGGKTMFVIKDLAEKYGVDAQVAVYAELGENSATDDAMDLDDAEYNMVHRKEAEKAAEFLKLLIENGELPKAKYPIHGNTYPVKDQLKELGAKFSGDCWEIELEKLEEAKAIVANQ